MLAYRAEVRAVTADTTPVAPEAADEAADEAELARATGAGAAPNKIQSKHKLANRSEVLNVLGTTKPPETEVGA